jgi:hypothetical protein
MTALGAAMNSTPGKREHTRAVEATVIAVLPDYRQVRVKTADGYQYAITANTPGVDWHELREGQHILCTVTTSLLPIVLEASLLP